MKTPPLPSPSRGSASKSSRPSQRAQGAVEHTRLPSRPSRSSLDATPEEPVAVGDISLAGDEARSSGRSLTRDNGLERQSAGTQTRDDSVRTLAELRRRMDEQLVLQQQRRPSADRIQESPRTRASRQSNSSSTVTGAPSPENARLTQPPDFFSPPFTDGQTTSTESGRTVRGVASEDIIEKPSIRTPSYPFPHMAPDSPSNDPRGLSAFHRPFTLLSPTDGHHSPGSTHIPNQNSSSQAHYGRRPPFSPPSGVTPLDHPNFPVPNLYDITLMLNSEPGLEAWWQNVAQIMQEYYLAERVTLSVPGDVTDLENVPWGQKAVFNSADVRGELEQASRHVGDEVNIGDHGFDERSKRLSDNDERTSKFSISPRLDQRPSLQNRHSFAGYVKKLDEGLFRKGDEEEQLQRPKGPLRSVSNLSMHDARLQYAEKRKGQFDLDENELSSETRSAESRYFDAPESPLLKTNPARVFRVPQPLERERDPIIKRSGVVRLLSRDKVVVITREYKSETETNTESLEKRKPLPQTAQGKDDNAKDPSAGRARSSSTLSTKSARSTRKGALTQYRHEHKASSNSQTEDGSARSSRSKPLFYEEYEQLPTSPWTQSPAPSPAPLSDPEQNPFFQPATVDEEAFVSQHTSHDYSQTQPLEAIGVDTAKTILHIPLVRRPIVRRKFSLRIARPSTSPSDPVFSSQGSKLSKYDNSVGNETPTLFSSRRPAPIAIVSVLASTVPYPLNLLQSLHDLTPHLTCSFSIAQQFSTLERQTADVARFGDGVGTFSTTSSNQLEAVIEQREQLYSPATEDEQPISAGSSVRSPSEHSDMLRASAPGSTIGTPAWDASRIGMSTDTVMTPGHRSNVEGVDSYFSARTPVTHLSSAKMTSPRRPVSKRKPSEQEFQRSIPKTSRLHTLGANLGATFPMLQEAQESLYVLPSVVTRSSQDSRKLSGAAPFVLKEPSEHLIRLLVDFLPLQIFTAEPHTGILTWVNSKFIAYRSQDVEEIFHDPWRSVHSADREDFLSGWKHALQHEQQYSCQIRLKRYDDSGDYRWFHFRAVAMLTSSGVAVHWLGTLTDIHKQHQAEVEAAREKQMVLTEAKYRALANLSPLIVFAAEEAKGIIFANDQWEAFSGQKMSDAMNFGFMSYLHPDDVVNFKLPVSKRPQTAAENPAESGVSSPPSADKVFDTSTSRDSTVQKETRPYDTDTSSETSGDVLPALVDLANRGIIKIQRDHKANISYSAEIRLRSDNGEYRWHLVRLVQVESINFGHGEASWYGTCTDINDHKMLEQKLNQTMESKSNFFSTMSHELRTPLNGIIGNIPFLLEGDLSQEQTSLLETMQGSAVNLLDLINNIMDLSKVEAGRMSISMHWFHVRSVIEDVNDTVAPKAIEKQLELNYLVDDDVPSMVKGDPFRIRQILINLLSNAIKFTNIGGVFIHCGVQRDPDRVLAQNETILAFEVIDTGMGFSEDDAKLLFQKFSQIDGSNTRQHGGSGLGLMISRQLVELHGGKLNATSVPGLGSTFSFFARFSVPTDDDRPSSPPRPEALTRMSTTSSVGSRGPIMSPDAVKFAKESDVESPAVNSSASSDPSIRSMSNYRSERSSLSSIVPSDGSPIKLSMPFERRVFNDLPSVVESGNTPMPSIAKSMGRPSMPKARQESSASEAPRPALYSILVVCRTDQDRAAIMQHIEHVIPDNIPHSVTDCGDIRAAQEMISGENAVLFTHIVLNLRETEPVVDFLYLVTEATPQIPTSLVVITDHIQKRELVTLASTTDFARLELEGKVHVVYRPSKPSKFAVIFDPDQERDLSKDRNRRTAQEISDNFKVTAQLVKQTIGDRGYRILIVEDNKTNLDVMLRYLNKVRLTVEVAQHGLECTNLVFAQEANYYSLILCDLKMPVKDGFETVRDIRVWESAKGYSSIPIIALSANAMPEDIDRALKSGFSTYFTKPIHFPDFGRALMDLLSHRIPPSVHEVGNGKGKLERTPMLNL